MGLKYIESTSVDPEFNLALEQYVFDFLPKDDEYFMLWQNDKAIIVGKHQNSIEEIDRNFVEQNDIKLVRRLSGGGAVYHDLGNLNFTFIVDGKNLETIDFKLFCEPISRVLSSLGIESSLSGRNDITIDGKKFSGNSQYIKNSRVMHHGTIMFNSDLDVLTKALKVSKDKIESKGIKSIKSRVTNVYDYLKEEISLEEFKKIILKHIFQGQKIEPYKLTEEDFKLINEIKEQRYSTWEWNYGNSPAYTVTKSSRLEGVGKIDLFLLVEDGIIRSCKIYGDFFSVKDPNEIEKKLVGIKDHRNSYEEALKNEDLSLYFRGIKNEDFIDLLCR